MNIAKMQILNKSFKHSRAGGILSTDGDVEKLTKGGEKKEKKAAGNAWANVSFVAWLDWRRELSKRTWCSTNQDPIKTSVYQSNQWGNSNKRSRDDSRAHSHNIWRINHIPDCDIIFFLPSLGFGLQQTHRHTKALLLVKFCCTIRGRVGSFHNYIFINWALSFVQATEIISLI